jgi:hypothetical protein
VGGALVVVWADPGVTTGWCVLRVPIKRLLELGQVGCVPFLWWRIGQYRSPDTSSAVDTFLGLAREVWARSEEGDLVVVGCEGFSLEMLSRDVALREPVRFLAVLRDRLRGTGVGVEVQMPGERTVITDARLQLWGLHQPGLEHGRDAERHGLVFLRRFASQEALRKRLGWEEG